MKKKKRSKAEGGGWGRGRGVVKQTKIVGGEKGCGLKEVWLADLGKSPL